MRFRLQLGLLAALAFSAPAPASAAKGEQHFFFAPGVTTSCEMDAAVPKIGTAAFCQTYPHTESVVLHANGRLTICHGIKCIGNPPEGVPTLTYGAWLDTGPFRCTSLHKGVKCVVRRTGKGFLISPTSIKRLG
jgi:hypothetical protein